MPYNDGVNLLVIVTKLSMINEIACGNKTHRATAVGIPHQVYKFQLSCAEFSAAVKVSSRPVHTSRLLQNMPILYVKYLSRHMSMYGFI